MASLLNSSSPSSAFELSDTFFQHTCDACALHEMIFDAEGAPADYRFLRVNPAFVRITGIPASAVGRNAREMLPNLEAHRIETYGSVVQTGEVVRFEHVEETLGKHFEVVAFPAAANQFGCIFRDITERKNAERHSAWLNHFDRLLSQVRQAIIGAESLEELTAALTEVPLDGGRLMLHLHGASGDRYPCTVCARAAATNEISLGFPMQDGCGAPNPSAPRCAAIPIHAGDHLQAILCVDAPGDFHFGEPEMALLAKAAADLSQAFAKYRAGALRRQAEMQLSREKEIIRAVLDHLAESVIACGSEGQVVFANRSAREWCVRDDGASDAALPPECIPLLERVQQGEKVRNVALSVGVQGGESRHFLASGTLVHQGGASPSLALLNLLDVTELETAQRMIRENEERWQHALHGAGLGVWDADVQTGRSHYSRHWKAMLGYQESDIGDTFEDWEQLVHPADLPLAKASMERHLAGDSLVYCSEYRMRASDGAWRWIQGRGKVVHRDENGQPKRVVGTHTDITERRLAEQKLRESEERFRLIAENTGDVIWLVDSQTLAISYVSPSVHRVSGLTPEEIIERGILALLTTESREYALDSLHRRVAALESGDEAARVAIGELNVYAKDGSVMPTEVVTTLLTGADRKVREVLGISRDIRQRKAAEEALRSSQAQLAEAMELAKLAHWRFNVTAGHFIFNDRFYALCGTTAEREGGYEMTPEVYVRAFVHPEDSARVASVMSPSRFAPGLAANAAHLEHRIIRRDGEIRHIAVGFEAVVDDSGSSRELIGVNQDITERRRAEQDLRASELRFRSLINDSPVAICVAAPTRITFANAAFLKLTGYPSEEAIRGVRLHGLIAPESRKQADHWLRLRSYGHEAPEKVELIGLRSDGSRFPLEVAVSFLQFPEGPVLVAFVSDLTAQRQAHEEREKLQAQLLEAHRMESIGRLAGGIAHDFNNLLTVINGYSSLILSRVPASDPISSAADHIQTAGERAAALVRQLLAFGRKQMLQPELLDLNVVVSETARMLPHVLNHTIELSLAGLACGNAVLVDRQQLEHILITLVVNAKDAMPAGGTLSLETRDVTVARNRIPGQFVKLTVRDTGTGMDDDTKAHLFEPFFSKKPGEPVTGLGLASVHGVMAQSEGFIEIESEPGRGSAFHLYFPAASPRVEAAAAERPSSSSRGTETILLVEDQDDVRGFVATVLSGRGYTVLQASSGREALEICAVHTVSLLLSDIVMPRMNGLDLARQARLLRPGLKVLLMSGYTHPMETPPAKEHLNGTPLIEKPFTPDDLSAKVREVLGVPAHRAKVLIVDDEEDVRRFLCAVLEGAGYEAFEAEDGREAIRQMHSTRIDLVVTDLVMPDMEGLATIREVRRDYPKVGIIAISGASGGQYLRLARPLGADGALRKPLQAQALINEARRVLALPR